MLQPNRIAFAGFEAVVGPFLLGLFWLFAVLGLAGLTALVLVGGVDSPAEGWGGVALLAVVVWWFTRSIARDLRRFRLIEVATDGAWTLRNALGVVLARIPADSSRLLSTQRLRIWSCAGGVFRRFTVDCLELSADGRRLRSCGTDPAGHARARQQLERLLAPAE